MYYIKTGDNETGWYFVMYHNGTIQSGPYSEKKAQEECDNLNN